MSASGDFEIHCLVSGRSSKVISKKKDGYVIHYLPIIRGIPDIIQSTLLFPLFLIIYGPLIIRKYKIDIIHGHTTLFGGIQSILLAKLVSLPVMLTLHGLDPYSWLLRQARIISIQTKAEYEMLGRKRLSPRILRHAPNCIEVGEAIAAQQTGSCPTVVFVGRLTLYKRPDLFIRAFALVANEVPDINALVFGDGEMMDNVVSLAKNLGVSDRIKFEGFVESPYSNLGPGDIFIACSHICNYLSTSVLEAMDRGLAIVATNVGGTSQAIHDMHNGVLVDPSPRSIANAILQLTSNRELRIELGKAARETLIQRFSQSRLDKWHENLYSAIVEEIHSKIDLEMSEFDWIL